MSAPRIQRYILREIAVPAAMGLIIFTFVLLMGRTLKLVEMVVNKGVPLGEMLRLFFCLMPAFLVITLPLSFLLGVLLGFGRLSSDGEIIALKSSGISLYGLLRPVLVLALIFSAATSALTLWAEPAGNASFRTLLFQIAASRASVGIEPRVFNDEFDGLVLYADGVDEQTGAMKGLFISDERMDKSPATITASRGRLISDPEALVITLRLEDGAIHRRPAGERESYQTIHFASYDINLNMGQKLAAEERPRKAKEMTLAELREAALDGAHQQQRAFGAEVHRRLILPLAPLLFALVAVPLGIQNQRSGRGGGFAVGLGVFLFYYILHSFAETLAVEGGYPMGILWAPTVLFLGAGLYLVRLSALERRVYLLDVVTEGVRRTLRRLARPARNR